MRHSPYPYAGPYRWALLFPHVRTFLGGARGAAPAPEGGDRGEDDGEDDGAAAAVLGFDMLAAFAARAPGIRPARGRDGAPSPPRRRSSEPLESTVVALLGHVVRLSRREATAGAPAPSERGGARKYSSREVMQMTRTLLGFHDPATQICALSRACPRIRAGPTRALLPNALDCVRPILMGMCGRVAQYGRGNDAAHDMAMMRHIISLLDLFLPDVFDAFQELGSPMPRDLVEFMASAELFSAVFALLRLQRMWISRCQREREEVAGGVETGTSFDEIVQWADARVGPLEAFHSSLSRFIQMCEASEDKPNDWHRLYIMRLSLRDALAEPGT